MKRFIFSALLILAATLSSARGKWDCILDRYDAICDSSIALRLRIENGEKVSADEASSIKTGISEIRAVLSEGIVEMTSAQRSRFRKIRDRYEVRFGLRKPTITKAVTAPAPEPPRAEESTQITKIDTIILKYNWLEKYGNVDGKSVLDPEDDAATAALGPEWRTPTYEEWLELKYNCSFKLDTVDEVIGWRATSKVEGYTDKSLFFPFKATFQPASTYKVYASATLSSQPTRWKFIRMNSGGFGFGHSGLRSSKGRIRPVTGAPSADAVDLGLSVKWATKNLGTSSETEFGNMYMYGYIQPHEKGHKYRLIRYDTTRVKRTF